MHEQLNKVHTVFRRLPEFAINCLNFANQLIPFKLRESRLLFFLLLCFDSFLGAIFNLYRRRMLYLN